MKRSVTPSTKAVMLAMLLSMVLGFAREVVNAKYFGERWELDAFLVAAILPTLVFGVFNGALVSALVPIFSGYFAEGKDEEAWRFSSTVINGLIIVLSVLAAIAWLAAPWLVHLVAKGFPGPETGVTVRMTRIQGPTIVATSIAGVVQALLNAQRSFRAASLQGAALNLVTIAGVLLLYQAYGIYALVFGTAVGLFAQLAVQLPNYFKRCKYRFVLDLHHPGLRTLAFIVGPIIVGSAAGQINLLFDKYFASTLLPGNIAAMQYATKVVGFPQQLFAVAIATVMFPILSAHFAKSERESLRSTAFSGLRITALITIPSAFAPASRWRDQLSASCSSVANLRRVTSSARREPCRLYAIGLLGIAASIVLTRCFFAMHDLKTPVIVASGVVALNVVCSALTVRQFGINGLAASNSLASLVEAALLGYLLIQRIGVADGEFAGTSFASTAVASAAMAVISSSVATALWHVSAPFWQHCAVLALAILAGAVTFLLVGAALRIRELSELWAVITSRAHPSATSA